MGRRGRTWWVTAALALASAWTLDAIAAGAGVLLVASGLMHGWSHDIVLAVLVASYGLWAAGMQRNLAANAQLLVATGTSSNLLSKFAFGIAVRRSASVRVHRAASAVGYALAETAKEVPYVFAALGAAFWSDAVTRTDALIFLAGTNVGACAYELGAARLTRSVLSSGRRRPNEGDLSAAGRRSTAA